MKRSYITILLIFFQVSCLRAMEKSDQETTSSDAQIKKNPPTSPSSSSPPPIDSGDQYLLNRLISDPDIGPRSFIRLKSIPGDEREHHLSLSDEDRKEGKEDMQNIQLLSERKKPGLKSGQRKYWPKKLPHTGSMTPYRFLLDTIPELEYFKKPEERELYKGYTSVRMWTLFRHEIRYPSKETAHGMRTRLRNIKESAFLKLYENQDYHTDNTVINMEKFVKQLHAWDVVEELSKGLIYVSNETLNRRKSKEELEEEFKHLPLAEQEARLKKRKGADEQIDEAKDLTPLGKLEMRATGKRFLTRFEDLLKNAEPESRLFKFTDCQRTSASAREFYSAVYGEVDENDKSWHAPIDTGDAGKDPLLKYDALCGHWKKNYKKSNLNAHQLETFVTGKEMKNALKGIRLILRFVKKSITFSDGKMFYESCAFELAWQRDNPWCTFITEKYQAVFEYMEDFELYKNDGPDNEMNKKVGCFLFRDMIQRLIGKVEKNKKGDISWDLQLEEDGTDKGTVSVKTDETDETDQTGEKTEEPDTPKTPDSPKESDSPKKSDETDETKSIKKATFYFTHLTAVLKFITHLEVHVDRDPLSVDNFDRMQRRRWRSSRIGNFGTNVTFSLLKKGRQFFLLALHQERPLILPQCKAELCPIEVFLKAYHNSIFNCNYKEICEKYKNPYFAQSLKPFRDTTPHTNIATFSFSSTSSAASPRSASFGTKEAFV